MCSSSVFLSYMLGTADLLDYVYNQYCITYPCGSVEQVPQVAQNESNRMHTLASATLYVTRKLPLCKSHFRRCRSCADNIPCFIGLSIYAMFVLSAAFARTTRFFSKSYTQQTYYTGGSQPLCTSGLTNRQWLQACENKSFYRRLTESRLQKFISIGGSVMRTACRNQFLQAVQL